MTYEAEFLATTGSYSLVRWQGRKFPGLLVQGDTLWTVKESLTEAAAELDTGNLEDATAAIHAAQEAIEDMLASYERMMSSAGVKLPYFK